MVKPDTVRTWHRELVLRKWTFRGSCASGRPATPAEVQALSRRLARENASWGYSRIHEELTKLGYSVGRSTVRDILKRQATAGAPRRLSVAEAPGSTWRTILAQHRDEILACDFFTVETLFLKTIDVPFFCFSSSWVPAGCIWLAARPARLPPG